MKPTNLNQYRHVYETEIGRLGWMDGIDFWWPLCSSRFPCPKLWTVFGLFKIRNHCITSEKKNKKQKQKRKRSNPLLSRHVKPTCTRAVSSSCPSSPSSTLTLRLTLPTSVNLMALQSMFSSTWAMREGSPTRRKGKSTRSKTMEICRSSTGWWRKMCSVEVRSWERSKGIRSRSVCGWVYAGR